jgi:phosphoglycolate phosphatase-like HAD superfamily hydrolase
VTPDPPAADLLEGIDLVIFDKDGTLIEFHHMWGGWVRELARRLARRTGLELEDSLYALLGVERTSGLVDPGGLLAATPMSRIRELVGESLIDAGITPQAAEAAVADAWHAPDPVDLARPTTDLQALLDRVTRRVGHLAVATSDDREPTERTLRALGIAERFAALACADDGHPTKPAPDPVLVLCRALRVSPDRTAVVGDAPADLRMARAAGARRAIGVLTGVGDADTLAPLADAVLASIAELA